jgi:pilus assembly protein Flp/PilA
MQGFARSVLQFLRSEDGPTAVEYAVMMGFIITVCVAGITSLGKVTLGLFATSAEKLR